VRILVEPGDEVAGTVGYWEREWQGERVYETGYAILPEFQGRGLAVAALRAVVSSAAGEGALRYIHAFPHVEHAASNAVCRKAGFELVGMYEFEYPKGHFAPSSDWRLDLTGISLADWTRLAVGGWRLAVGGWRLAVGGWRLAVGGWRLAVGDICRKTD
jgi:RimJ/RimL family protein N-acetyltransferase